MHQSVNPDNPRLRCLGSDEPRQVKPKPWRNNVVTRTKQHRRPLAPSEIVLFAATLLVVAIIANKAFEDAMSIQTAMGEFNPFVAMLVASRPSILAYDAFIVTYLVLLWIFKGATNRIAMAMIGLVSIVITFSAGVATYWIVNWLWPDLDTLRSVVAKPDYLTDDLFVALVVVVAVASCACIMMRKVVRYP